MVVTVQGSAPGPHLLVAHDHGIAVLLVLRVKTGGLGVGPPRTDKVLVAETGQREPGVALRARGMDGG